MSNGSVSASNCSLSHSVDEIKAMIWKQIKEDKVRQLTIMNLAVEFENASITKDDMRKAYEECNDIPEEKRALIHIVPSKLVLHSIFVKHLAYGDDSFLASGIVYITLFLNILFDFFD
ncbi:hypothetical protein Tco_1386825, partial [Tanacetum coccineum]